MEATGSEPGSVIGNGSNGNGTGGNGHGSHGHVGSELRDNTRSITESAKQRLFGEVEARKGTATQQAQAVSSALGRAGDQLGQEGPAWLRSAFQSAAKAVQDLADTVEHKDARELSRDVQQIARKNPTSFLAACAFTGFALARVMQAGKGSQRGSEQGLSHGGSEGMTSGNAAFRDQGFGQTGSDGSALGGSQSVPGAYTAPLGTSGEPVT